MKTITKKKTAHQKAIDRMQQETKRAISHVALLEKLYLETQKAKGKV